MKAISLAFVLASGAVCAATPKYVFLFIGDGMSTPQRMVAEEFARKTGHGDLAMNHLPYQANTRTKSASSIITDSAAAATAIACGVKTDNGKLGVDPSTNRLVSVAEVAKKRGMKVGIVTTVTIVHATPAGFYAHVPARGMYYRIALDLVSSGFDYFAGAGVYDKFDDRRDPLYRGNVFELAKKAGVDLSGINVAVVQGLGPVGTFALMYLKAQGVKKVYAITAGNDLTRENTALSLGADKVFNLTREGTEAITKALQSENGGLGDDLVIECSGAPSAVAQGMDILRNRGVYLVPGQYSASGGIEIQPQLITFKALHIIGSSQYSMCDVHKYLDFLSAHGELYEKIEKLGTKFKVSEINEAIAYAKSGKNVKTLLVK